jgi:nucleoside-diphosphate-sugar epimerase
MEVGRRALAAGAVVGVHDERGTGHMFTEDDWDLSASETFLPYHYSKTLAELDLWKLHEQQSRWSLVTLQPGIIQGPPLGELKLHTRISVW